MQKRSKAIFTKIKDGHEMLQIWYKYYSQFFPEQDIYILDFESADGSTDKLNCNIEKFSSNLYLPGGGAENIFKTLNIE